MLLFVKGKYYTNPQTQEHHIQMAHIPETDGSYSRNGWLIFAGVSLSSCAWSHLHVLAPDGLNCKALTALKALARQRVAQGITVAVVGIAAAASCAVSTGTAAARLGQHVRNCEVCVHGWG